MSDPAPRPTEAELAILRVLWGAGPSTVREVQEGLVRTQGREVGYTTALKLLQIMTDKGLVRRDEEGRAHVYRAAQPEERTQRRLVEDLLERAFAGAAGRLALQALRAGDASREELAAIRRLLDELEPGEAAREEAAP